MDSNVGLLKRTIGGRYEKQKCKCYDEWVDLERYDSKQWYTKGFKGYKYRGKDKRESFSEFLKKIKSCSSKDLKRGRCTKEDLKNWSGKEWHEEELI